MIKRNKTSVSLGQRCRLCVIKIKNKKFTNEYFFTNNKMFYKNSLQRNYDEKLIAYLCCWAKAPDKITELRVQRTSWSR